MHAMALEELAPYLTGDGCKVLDVGCGSGYLSSCFFRLIHERNGKVYGVDYLEPLVELSRTNISKDDPRMLQSIHLETGDGWKGLESFAPFDAIHVGAAASSVPDSLMDQLKPGGAMLIPVGPAGEAQQLIKVLKELDSTITKHFITSVIYVPLVQTSIGIQSF